MLAATVALAVLVAACSAPSAPGPLVSPTSDATPAASTPTPTPTPAETPVGDPSPAATTVLPGASWIVYQLWDGRADVRLVRPDGTGDHPLLASPPGEQFHPDWSPDGLRVAFEMEAGIWTARVDGSDLREVASCLAPCRGLGFPAWSPDGTRIAFTRLDLIDGQNPGSVVQAVDLDSGAIADLLRTEGAEYANGVRWSPDGRSVVLEVDRYLDTGNDTTRVTGSIVATAALDGPDPTLRPLTEWATFGTYPDWSPDGRSIVFSTRDLGVRDNGGFEDPAPPSDLFTIAPDGSDLTQLTSNPSGTTLVRNGSASGPLSSQPTWSPDGSSIVFVQIDGPSWPGWGMASIPAGGGEIAPAVGDTFQRGTHPRLRPLP